MKDDFNYEEFLKIKEIYGKEAIIDEIELNFTNKKYINEMKDNIEKDRRGEVAFGVIRPNGKTVLVRTSFYPKGIYRIPTGGINHGEDIIKAVYREEKEELGLEVEISKFLGVIKFKMKYEQGEIYFYSYAFLLKELGGKILVDALEDEVSEYIEVNEKELKSKIKLLESMDNNWKDWCRFRAKTTEFIYKGIFR